MSDPEVRAGRRERSLVEAFVLLADTVAEDYDVVDLLDRLVNTAVDLLQVAAAGLMLTDQRGRLALVASSDERTAAVELLQIQVRQGPCLDCVTAGRPVRSDDLSRDADRWPLFVPAAHAVGFASVHAVPLRLREQTVGGLNLFQRETGGISEDDAQIAQGLADVATIGILQQRFANRSLALAEQLERALDSRVVLEQAKGILAERHRVGLDTSFAMLRQYARDNNLRLSELARQVVAGDADPA